MDWIECDVIKSIWNKKPIQEETDKISCTNNVLFQFRLSHYYLWFVGTDCVHINWCSFCFVFIRGLNQWTLKLTTMYLKKIVLKMKCTKCCSLFSCIRVKKFIFLMKKRQFRSGRRDVQIDGLCLNTIVINDIIHHSVVERTRITHTMHCVKYNSIWNILTKCKYFIEKFNYASSKNQWHCERTSTNQIH